MFQFTDLNILIVGGSSGVGRATAKSFTESGANVTIASRSSARLADAAAVIGGEVETTVLDMRDNQAVKSFFSTDRVFDHIVVSAADTPMGSMTNLP